MKDRRSTLVALALLFALTLAMFGDVLVGGHGRVLGNETTDMYLQFFSWRDFGFRELAHGNLALWNPHIYSGAPYFGSMQAALLYPPNWIFLVLPVAVAINWSIALHVFLMGAFMFFWMRTRQLNVASSFFAGAIIMFGGTFFPRTFAGHITILSAMVWAPLIFCAIDRLLTKPGLSSLLLGMFAVAMQILAGFPQCVFYTAITAGLYCGLRLIQHWRERHTPKAIAMTAGVLLAIYPGAAALVAVQLLPGVQAAGETVRSLPLPFQFASMFAFPPENFLTLIAPYFLGPNEISSYWGRCYLWETSLFIGVTGLMLAVKGTMVCQRGTKWILLTLVGVILFVALGVHTPLFGFLYAHAPGFDRFRGITKFNFSASLFLVLLAATGLDHLFKHGKVGRTFIIAVFVSAILLAISGMWILQTAAWPRLMNSIQATGESFLAPQFYASAKFISQSRSIAALSIFLAAGTCALLGGVFVLVKRDARALYGVIALGLVEVFVFARISRATFDSGSVSDPAEKSFLAEHPGDYRIINLVNPNSAMSLGTQDLWGADSGVVRRYAEFIAWAQGLDPDQATQNARFSRFDPLHAMLRLRYVFGQNEDGFQVAEAPAAPMPHLVLVSNYRVLKDRQEIFGALRSYSFDPRREVILECEPEPKPLPGQSAGTAQIVEQSTDELAIEANIEQASILLITDVYTPAWRAISLQGSAQSKYELLPANYVLRAIPLSAGHHRLRVVYAPSALAIGKWISIVAGCFFLVAIAWSWRRESLS